VASPSICLSVLDIRALEGQLNECFIEISCHRGPGRRVGGTPALSELPPDLEAALLVVLHTADRSGSLLPRILGRAGKLPVFHPRDGDRIQHGRVYIAPPGFHMIVERDLLRVLQGPSENL
jgi:two-component system chemotaxis response regulator CheB